MQTGDIELAVTELIVATSKEEIASALIKWPVLLMDESLVLIGQMAETLPDRGLELERLLDLLMECRALGIESALESFNGPVQDGGDDDWQEAVSLLLEAQGSAELAAVVEQHPVLLTDAVVQKLVEIEADMGEYSADRMYALVSFLRTCRSRDLSAAQRNYEHDIAEVEAANKLFAEFVFTEDDKAAEDLLKAHPILLRRQAERGFESLLGEDPANESAGVVAMLALGRRRAEQARLRRVAVADRR